MMDEGSESSLADERVAPDPSINGVEVTNSDFEASIWEPVWSDANSDRYDVVRDTLGGSCAGPGPRILSGLVGWLSKRRRRGEPTRAWDILSISPYVNIQCVEEYRLRSKLIKKEALVRVRAFACCPVTYAPAVPQEWLGRTQD